MSHRKAVWGLGRGFLRCDKCLGIAWDLQEQSGASQARPNPNHAKGTSPSRTRTWVGTRQKYPARMLSRLCVACLAGDIYAWCPAHLGGEPRVVGEKIEPVSDPLFSITPFTTTVSRLGAAQRQEFQKEARISCQHRRGGPKLRLVEARRVRENSRKP